MSFISLNRSQTDLIGYSIDDFAKSDKKSRFVVNIVSRLDLKELYSRYSNQGGESYSPDMMLALWFYAYSNGNTSTRNLEELCKYDTRYMYISSNMQPDHTTLSRFRKTHLDLISGYFLQILLIAREEGISAFNHIAIDGTKIKACRSDRHCYNESELDKLIAAARLDIERYMNQCNYVEQNATGHFDVDSLLAEKARLEAIEQDLLEHKALLNKRQQELKAEYRNKHKISLLEPDARFMPKCDGINYNAQASVDMDSKLITAAVVSDQPNDQGQFIQIQEQTENNLTADLERAYTGDAGYHNLRDLQELAENNIDVIIADPAPQNRSISEKPTSPETILIEKKKVERRDFVYHEQGDYYECPNGDHLRKVESKGKSFVYRAVKCKECPLALYCITSGTEYKQIQRSKLERYAEEMARQLQTPQAKKRLCERMTSVEPVFGNLKHNLGFRRFSLWGIKQADGEFKLMAIAHNLNIMFKRMCNGNFLTSVAISISKIKHYITVPKRMLIKLNSNFNNLYKIFYLKPYYC